MTWPNPANLGWSKAQPAFATVDTRLGLQFRFMHPNDSIRLVCSAAMRTASFGIHGTFAEKAGAGSYGSTAGDRRPGLIALKRSLAGIAVAAMLEFRPFGVAAVQHPA